MISVEIANISAYLNIRLTRGFGKSGCNSQLTEQIYSHLKADVELISMLTAKAGGTVHDGDMRR